MRQPRQESVGFRGKRLLCVVVWLGAGVGCAAPISTQRSPMHLRFIELRNDTDRELVLTIEPAADQHLEAPTTFTVASSRARRRPSSSTMGSAIRWRSSSLTAIR